MRYATVRVEGRTRFGVVEGDTIRLLPPAAGSLAEMVAAGERGAAWLAEQLAGRDLERRVLSACEIASPLDRYPRDVVCVGLNYRDHFEEGRSRRPDVAYPEAPVFFTKGPDAMIGPRDAIGHDAKLSSRWDYEAEIAVVIGRTGRSIPRRDALDHVFGYCLANDVSQRDLQRRHGGQWLKGKSIDGTTPIGPVIVSPDEVDLATTRLTCSVNGELRQSALVGDMVFSVADIIAELSFGMTLRAGDVILTGTPSGVGNSRKPPVYLQPGDVVVVTGGTLGELRNEIVAVDLVGSSDVLAAA